MIRAYSYLRVSSRGQGADDKDGFPRQRRAIADFAVANGLEIVGEFADKITGKTETMDRPLFHALLDCVQNRRRNGTSDLVDVIIIERQDRLARDLLAGELILETCRKQGLKVYSTDQGMIDIASDDADPTRILIRQIMGCLAQWEKSTLVRKLRVARERAKHARGQTKGEAAIYALIQKMYAEGNSFRKIEKFLGEEGILTSNGKPYQLSRLWAVVKKGTECTDQQQSVL